MKQGQGNSVKMRITVENEEQKGITFWKDYFSK